MESNTALLLLNEQQAAAAENPNTPLHPLPQQPAIAARYLDDHSRWLEATHGALMVVATVVAGFALLAGLNPPGGLLDKRYFDGKQFHEQGTAVLALMNPLAYTQLYNTQTVALLASLTVILLSVSGMPFNRQVHVWVLRIITWAAITCLAIMDKISVEAFSPTYIHAQNEVLTMTVYGIATWCVVMSLILLALLVRVIGRLVCRMRG